MAARQGKNGKLSIHIYFPLFSKSNEISSRDITNHASDTN